MAKFILSVDQSTSATKAIIFDENDELVSRSTIEHRRFYPQPDWMEHDPEEIYQNTCRAMKVQFQYLDLVQLSSPTNAQQPVAPENRDLLNFQLLQSFLILA